MPDHHIECSNLILREPVNLKQRWFSEGTHRLHVQLKAKPATE